MAKKEKGRIEIVCNNDKEVTVTVEGERPDLIAALAGLISDDDENNEFHQLIHVAMTVALYKKQLDEEKSKKRLTPPSPWASSIRKATSIRACLSSNPAFVRALNISCI